MDFAKVPLLGMMKRRLDWLTQRQEVIARNIANADTPKYAPRDLQPLDFKEEVRRAQPVNMAVTAPEHLAGRPRAEGPFRAGEVRKPYETAPDGNAVIIEEQSAKITETNLNHDLTTQIYKKYIEMFRIAAGRAGSG